MNQSQCSFFFDTISKSPTLTKKLSNQHKPKSKSKSMPIRRTSLSKVNSSITSTPMDSESSDHHNNNNNNNSPHHHSSTGGGGTPQNIMNNNNNSNAYNQQHHGTNVSAATMASSSNSNTTNTLTNTMSSRQPHNNNNSNQQHETSQNNPFGPFALESSTSLFGNSASVGGNVIAAVAGQNNNNMNNISNPSTSSVATNVMPFLSLLEEAKMKIDDLNAKIEQLESEKVYWSSTSLNQRFIEEMNEQKREDYRRKIREWKMNGDSNRAAFVRKSELHDQDSQQLVDDFLLQRLSMMENMAVSGDNENNNNNFDHHQHQEEEEFHQQDDSPVLFAQVNNSNNNQDDEASPQPGQNNENNGETDQQPESREVSYGLSKDYNELYANEEDASPETLKQRQNEHAEQQQHEDTNNMNHQEEEREVISQENFADEHQAEEFFEDHHHHEYFEDHHRHHHDHHHEHQQDSRYLLTNQNICKTALALATTQQPLLFACPTEEELFYAKERENLLISSLQKTVAALVARVAQLQEEVHDSNERAMIAETRISSSSTENNNIHHQNPKMSSLYEIAKLRETTMMEENDYLRSQLDEAKFAAETYESENENLRLAYFNLEQSMSVMERDFQDERLYLIAEKNRMTERAKHNSNNCNTDANIISAPMEHFNIELPPLEMYQIIEKKQIVDDDDINSNDNSSSSKKIMKLFGGMKEIEVVSGDWMSMFIDELNQERKKILENRRRNQHQDQHGKKMKNGKNNKSDKFSALASSAASPDDIQNTLNDVVIDDNTKQSDQEDHENNHLDDCSHVSSPLDDTNNNQEEDSDDDEDEVELFFDKNGNFCIPSEKVLKDINQRQTKRKDSFFNDETNASILSHDDLLSSASPLLEHLTLYLHGACQELARERAARLEAERKIRGFEEREAEMRLAVEKANTASKVLRKFAPVLQLFAPIQNLMPSTIEELCEQVPPRAIVEYLMSTNVDSQERRNSLSQARAQSEANTNNNTTSDSHNQSQQQRRQRERFNSGSGMSGGSSSQRQQQNNNNLRSSPASSLKSPSKNSNSSKNNKNKDNNTPLRLSPQQLLSSTQLPQQQSGASFSNQSSPNRGNNNNNNSVGSLPNRSSVHNQSTSSLNQHNDAFAGSMSQSPSRSNSVINADNASYFSTSHQTNNTLSVGAGGFTTTKTNAKMKNQHQQLPVLVPANRFEKKNTAADRQKKKQPQGPVLPASLAVSMNFTKNFTKQTYGSAAAVTQHKKLERRNSGASSSQKSSLDFNFTKNNNQHAASAAYNRNSSSLGGSLVDDEARSVSSSNNNNNEPQPKRPIITPPLALQGQSRDSLVSLVVPSPNPHVPSRESERQETQRPDDEDASKRLFKSTSSSRGQE